MHGTICSIQTDYNSESQLTHTEIQLKGCKLHCQWCAKPQLQKRFSELIISTDKCTGCGKCVASCPEQALSILRKSVHVQRISCTACGKCVSVCPTNALKIIGKKLSAQAVLEQVLDNIAPYSEQQGIASITGGEPLLQVEFLQELLPLLKQHGLEIEFNTHGVGTFADFEAIMANIDHVLYHLPACTELQFNDLMQGKEFEMVIQNLDKLNKQWSEKLAVYIPLMHDINTTKEHIANFLLLFQRIAFRGMVCLNTNASVSTPQWGMLEDTKDNNQCNLELYQSIAAQFINADITLMQNS